MRACDDCNYYFGETCEHPDIVDDFEFGGLGDTFQWFDETPNWCPLKCSYGKRGKASTEFYMGDRPQIYCYGWADPRNDEPIDVCKNCADHVSRAQEDLERSGQ